MLHLTLNYKRQRDGHKPIGLKKRVFNNQVKPFLEIFNPYLPILKRLVHSNQTLEIRRKGEINNEEYVSQAIIEQVLLNCFLSTSEARVHTGHIDIEKNWIYSL